MIESPMLGVLITLLLLVRSFTLIIVNKDFLKGFTYQKFKIQCRMVSVIMLNYDMVKCLISSNK